MFPNFRTTQRSKPGISELRFESLEKRELMDAALANVLTTFNDGLERFRGNADRLATAAWSSDIADVPLLQTQLDKSLELGTVIGRLIPTTVLPTDARDAALADFSARGYVVEYLDSTPNAAGNFLEVRRAFAGQQAPVRNVPVGGSEGFTYLNKGAGEMSGLLAGNLTNITGAFRFVVDASGFRIGADSSLSAKVAVKGAVQGNYDMGVLDGVRTSGNAELSGKLSLRFRDRDGDRELSIADAVRNANVIGGFSGRVDLKSKFLADIPALTTVSWTASFDATIRDKSARTNETFALPDYNGIVKAARLGLVSSILKSDWFAKLEPYFDEDIPLIEKSLTEMLDIENKIGSGIALAGVSILQRPDEISRAMRNLIDGKPVDLMRVDTKGSLGIWAGDLIDPVLLGQVDWIPGVLSGKLEAVLRANLGFSYDIHAGVDADGLYVATDTRLAINGGIEGGIQGSIDVFGHGFAKASGTLALLASIDVMPRDPNGDGRVHLTEIRGRLEDNLISTIDVDLEARLKAKLDFVLFDVKVLDEKVKIADLVHETIVGGTGTTTARSLTRLPVEDALAPPTNVRVGSPTARQLTVAWDRSPDATAYVVRASKDGGKTWKNVSDRIAKSEDRVSVAVEPDTKYLFQVAAIDREGVGSLSESLEFTTPDGKLPPPTGLRLVSNGPREVEVRWNESEGESKYTVQVSTNGGESWSKQEDVPPDHAYSAKLTVEPGRSYMFRVVAVNEFGPSLPSNVIDVTTSDGKLPAPTGLRVVASGPREVEVRWDESSGESNYTIQVSTNGGASWGLQENVPADHAYSARLTVEPGRSYLFRVLAVNDFGPSRPSDPVTVTTPDGRTSPPTGLRTVAVGPREIEVRWDEVSGEQFYRVLVSTNGGASWSKQEDVPADHAYSAKLTVSPNKSYQFKVVAINEFGTSGDSNVIQVRSVGEPPAAPENLRLVAKRADGVEVKWDEVAGEDHYTVQVSTDNGRSWKKQEDVPADHAYSAKLSVAKGRTYWFRVIAVNEFGASLPSNILKVDL